MLVAKYYQDNKQLILEQTGYNERIIGKDDAEFYALKRIADNSEDTVNSLKETNELLREKTMVNYITAKAGQKL